MSDNFFRVLVALFGLIAIAFAYLFFVVNSLSERLEKLEEQLAPDEETKKTFNEAMDHLEAAMHVLVEHISGVRPS